MKSIKFFSLCLFISVFHLTSAGAANNTFLKCQLIDTFSNRILDEASALHQNSQSKAQPILFLLSYRSVTGLVKDSRQATAEDRKLEMKLSYHVSGAEGEAASEVLYRTDAIESTLNPLAETRLEEPQFQKELRLVCNLGLVQN